MAPRKGRKSSSNNNGRKVPRCGPSDQGCEEKKKTKRARNAPPNPFLLFFLDTLKREGGSMYCMAKVCGERWRKMPQSEKDKWKAKYCKMCTNCRSCKPKKGQGSGKGGGKGGGAGAGAGGKGGKGSKKCS